MWLVGGGVEDEEKPCSSADFFSFLAYSQNLQKLGPTGSVTASSITFEIIPSAPACGG